MSESPILRYFAADHLPTGPLRAVSENCADLARHLERTLSPGAEKSTALRKLLEAKDAAVRAALELDPYAAPSYASVGDLWRKRPVIVQATRWEGWVEDATRVIEWALTRSDCSIRYHEANASRPPRLAIDTLEGTMFAVQGDWIICGVQGELYPCKPDIFDATYEAVEVPPIE